MMAAQLVDVMTSQRQGVLRSVLHNVLHSSAVSSAASLFIGLGTALYELFTALLRGTAWLLWWAAERLSNASDTLAEDTWQRATRMAPPPRPAALQDPKPEHDAVVVPCGQQDPDGAS